MRRSAVASRIDPPAPRLHVIIDYAARRMSVVGDATRSVLKMAVGGSAATSFVRRGEAAVAGRVCTEWQTLDPAARQVPGTAR